MKNNIYINELFECDSTFLGYQVCENHKNVAFTLEDDTLYPLIENASDIRKYNMRVLCKGKNAEGYEFLSINERDEFIKKIYQYLSFALRRLEKEKSHHNSTIIKNIYEVLNDKDRYLDNKYPEHKHNM